MTRMIGRSLPHESEQELELIATEDQYLAPGGLCTTQAGREALVQAHRGDDTPRPTCKVRVREGAGGLAKDPVTRAESADT
jgi:hypothetical protein